MKIFKLALSFLILAYLQVFFANIVADKAWHRGFDSGIMARQIVDRFGGKPPKKPVDRQQLAWQINLAPRPYGD